LIDPIGELNFLHLISHLDSFRNVLHTEIACDKNFATRLPPARTILAECFRIARRKWLLLPKQ
jgi:hypothetical protein